MANVLLFFRILLRTICLTFFNSPIISDSQIIGDTLRVCTPLRNVIKCRPHPQEPVRGFAGNRVASVKTSQPSCWHLEGIRRGQFGNPLRGYRGGERAPRVANGSRMPHLAATTFGWNSFASTEIQIGSSSCYSVALVGLVCSASNPH